MTGVQTCALPISQEKVGGYSIDAYGYNDDFNDDVSIELSDGVGEQIPPTGQFKLTIIDEHGYIYDKPEQQYFTPFTEIKLHSYPIMDADLYMYVDGELYSKQTSIETDEGYIWEYTFTMPIGEAILEFSTDPFSPHTYYSFADIFNWVSLLNESTLNNSFPTHRTI